MMTLGKGPASQNKQPKGFTRLEEKAFSHVSPLQASLAQLRPFSSHIGARQLLGAFN